MIPPNDIATQNVVWRPHPGAQEKAVSCPCNEILFEGSRGPGKTDAQIMFFRSRVGMGYGAFWRGIIFDREYKMLEDIIAKTKKWFPKYKDGARFLSSKGDLKWVWPTGEELLFRAFEKPSDYDKYHGQEYPFMGWNELTKFNSPTAYDLMKSCNRCSFVPILHTPKNRDGTWATANGEMLPELPLTIFSTTNPIGVGHAWVKRRFIDVALPGQIHWTETEIYSARLKKRVTVRRSQVRLFASYIENPNLPDDYIANLFNESDPNRRKAWLLGDWDIVSGGAFEDCWDSEIHILEDFKVPANWRVDRAFDWGSSTPFSVGWYAQANGETVKVPDGKGGFRDFCPPRGTLIRIAEWYGTNARKVEEPTDKGLMLDPTEIAEGIMQKEMELIERNIISDYPLSGPADNQIFNDTRKDIATIAKTMEKEGIAWNKSDKSDGSRKNGLELMRTAFKNAKRGEGPGLYFTRSCKWAIALVPTIPRDPEDPDDVDTLSEDHIYDEIRYRVLDDSKKFSKGLNVTYSK